jgi:fucose permease
MKNKLLYSILALGFISIGLTATIIGPLLISIKKEIPMSYFQSGFLVSEQFIGIIFAVIFGGYLADKFGKKIFIFSGSIFLISGLLLSYFSINYTSLALSILIIGLGFGIYDIGLNSLCLDYIRDYPQNKQANIMNLLHSCYGIGAILGPSLAALSLKYLGSWRIVFAFLALFPFIVNILLLFLKYKKQIYQTGKIKIYNILNNLKVWIYGIALFLYVGIETSINGWIPSYYEKTFNILFITPALTATVFWFFLTFGRIVLGKVIAKIGIVLYLLISGIFVMALIVSWIIYSHNILIIIIVAFIGFSISCIFPSILTIAVKEYNTNTGIINSFMFIFASFGGFFVPWSMGKIFDKTSIGFMPFSLLFLSIAFIITAIIIFKKSKDNEIK